MEELVWSLAVVVLTRNSPPRTLPAVSYCCAKIPQPLPSRLEPDQVMTKSPRVSTATLEYCWSRATLLLTWNSPPTAVPEELNRCAKTPQKFPAPSWWLPLQVITKLPAESMPTLE